MLLQKTLVVRRCIQGHKCRKCTEYPAAWLWAWVAERCLWRRLPPLCPWEDGVKRCLCERLLPCLSVCISDGCATLESHRCKMSLWGNTPLTVRVKPVYFSYLRILIWKMETFGQVVWWRMRKERLWGIMGLEHSKMLYMGLCHEPYKFSISWEREKCEKETQNNPVLRMFGIRETQASFQVSVIVLCNNNVAFLYCLLCLFPDLAQLKGRQSFI